MSQPEQLITEHIDIWTSAILAKSTAGRGSSKKYELYGIKKLRELILELAVRGKLVVQDPNDEPAEKLLERIASAKSKLVQERKIKRSKHLPEIEEYEKYFELPQAWEWVRLGDLFRVTSGHNLSKNKMVDGNIPVFGGNGITGYHNESNVEKPTIVIGRVGYYCGSIHLTPAKAWITDNAFFTIYDEDMLFQDFVIWLLKTINLQVDTSATAQPVISGSKIYPIVIPLPPLNEQYRIVGKINELMLLCDQLEQQTEASIDAHATLVEVLLATLTDSADANELAQNWVRVSEYFDSLFTTEQSIEALKQTVLQLAVMGKLVPQNPDDEPASVLIENIIKEKNYLISTKQFQKTSRLNPKDNIVFPIGWVSVQVGELCPSIVPNRDKPKSFTGSIPWVTLPAFPKNNRELDTNKVELGLSMEEVKLYSARLIPINSVLMSCVGRFGLTAINRVPVSSNQQIHAFIILDGLLPELLCMVINTSAKALEKSSNATTISYLNKTKCESIQFGLPPIAEQHRIIAKVDELMTICDQLKEKLQQSQVTQIQLTDALIDKALI